MTTDQEILDKVDAWEFKATNSEIADAYLEHGVGSRKELRESMLMKLARSDAEKQMHGLSTARRLAEQVEQLTKQKEKAEAELKDKTELAVAEHNCNKYLVKESKEQKEKIARLEDALRSSIGQLEAYHSYLSRIDVCSCSPTFPETLKCEVQKVISQNKKVLQAKGEKQ